MYRQVYRYKNKEYAVWIYFNQDRGIAFPLKINDEHIRHISGIEMVYEGWEKV